MWLTDIMMILFAGAMTALIADMGKNYYPQARQEVVGGIAFAAIAVSLIITLQNWYSLAPGTVFISPGTSAFSTLYLVDSFSVFIVVTVLVVGAVICYYSLLYLKPDDNAGPFFALLLIMLLSLTGVSSAGDLLSLFLFWEGMSISAYGLVSFRRKSTLALEASIKYYFLAAAGSLLSLYGISIVFSLTGSIRLSSLSDPLITGTQTGIFGLSMLLIGFGVEAAIVPMHTWLPDVYSAAPTPVAALVSGAVTGTGMFVLVKIIQPLAMAGTGHPGQYLQGAQYLLIVLSVVTMLVGNLSAMLQTNLRRMLGFSSVAQTGYMLAALSTFSIPGLIAVVFNIWNHGLLKSNFFLLTGKNDADYSMTEMSSLSGMAAKSRLHAFMYASSSLGMVGSPPFGLFWSELLIVQSLLLAGGPVYTILAIVVVANIVLSIGYYFRVINTVVFGKAGEVPPHTGRIREIAAPLSLLLLSLLTGLIPGLFLNHIAAIGPAIP